MVQDTVTLAVIEDMQGKIPVVLPIDRYSYEGRNAPKDVATTGKYDKEDKAGDGLWARWGSNDDIPTAYRKMMESCDIAGATIGKISEIMYGDGLYWAADWGMKHKEGLSEAVNKEIQDFIDRNRIEYHYLPAQFADYRLLMNTFTEFWWSDDKKKITGMSHKPAEHCRLGYQDEKTGRIPWVIYSPDFCLGTDPKEDRLAPIDYLDWNQDDPIEMVRGKNFINHSYFPSPGMTYYAVPFWAGLFRDDGWINVNINIPQLINMISQNKAKLTYMIHIPINYFTARDPEFLTYDATKRQKIIDAKTAELNTLLKDSKNYYASLVSVFQEAEGTYEPFGKIEIVAIDDKSKGDTWMPDSNVSDAKIVQGLGLHPSQMGLAPEGGKMGAGSGSDQKEAFNTQNALVNIHEYIILSNLYNIVNKVNGWNAVFWMGKEKHVTKDESKSGVKPDTNIAGNE